MRSLRPLFVFGAFSFSFAAYAAWGTGQPVPARVASASGLVFDSAEMFVTERHVQACNNTWAHTNVDVAVDLLANDAVVIPNGTICGVDLDIDGPIVIEGHGTGGGTFVLELDVPVVHVEVSPQLTVANNTSAADWVELGAPGWVTATSLGLDPNEHIVVDTNHGLHAALAAALANDSVVLR